MANNTASRQWLGSYDGRRPTHGSREGWVDTRMNLSDIIADLKQPAENEINFETRLREALVTRWLPVIEQAPAEAPQGIAADWLEEQGHLHASWLVRNYKPLAELIAGEPRYQGTTHADITLMLTPSGLEYATGGRKLPKRKATRGKKYPLLVIGTMPWRRGNSDWPSATEGSGGYDLWNPLQLEPTTTAFGSTAAWTENCLNILREAQAAALEASMDPLTYVGSAAQDELQAESARGIIARMMAEPMMVTNLRPFILPTE